MYERPIASDLQPHRKTAIANLQWISEPFKLETQEGWMEISPETVDDWDKGYWISWSDDGSKPYSIAPSFVRENYEPIPAREAGRD